MNSQLLLFGATNSLEPPGLLIEGLFDHPGSLLANGMASVVACKRLSKTGNV